MGMLFRSELNDVKSKVFKDIDEAGVVNDAKKKEFQQMKERATKTDKQVKNQV